MDGSPRWTLADPVRLAREGEPPQPGQVLLAGTNEEAAMACATDIYNSVHLLTLRYGLAEMGQVDVSIGIASYPQHTQSDSLLRAADAALYRAKELGRSRIVSFGMLKAE